MPGTERQTSLRQKESLTNEELEELGLNYSLKKKYTPLVPVANRRCKWNTYPKVRKQDLVFKRKRQLKNCLGDKTTRPLHQLRLAVKKGMLCLEKAHKTR